MSPSPFPLVRESFPAFRAATEGTDHPAWHVPVDWADERFFEPVARLIDGYIQGASGSADGLQALARAILADLRQLHRDLTGDALAQCHYLQLHVGLCLMDFGRQTGMLQITYDWIILSITDHDAADQEVVFDYPRFESILRSPHLIVCLQAVW